jgi:DNA processing protein
MHISEEDFQLMALQAIDGLGPIKANLLLKAFKNPEEIFLASRKEIKTKCPTIPEDILKQINDKLTFNEVETELKFCEKHKIEIVTYKNENYPVRLHLLEDKPLVLFKRGQIYPKIKRSLAIVGTRKSTEYGHKFLEHLFEEMKGIENLIVVSGLALGIDQKAHTLSVKNNIPTLAVMGLSLDKIYPTQNANLAKSILESEGGWISETTSQSKTSQGVFPRRNRLIAGLCDGLIVAETDLKGGSIITALLANDYGKEVFALPGRISDAQSRGCNDLIKKNLATLVNTPQDLIEAMSWNTHTNKKLPKTLELDFEGTSMQKKVLDVIRKTPKIELEKLLFQSQLEHGQLVETLLELELQGMINTLPGNKYELI